MMAGSHMVVGAALWAVAANLAGHSVVEPPALAAAAFGALLPDIDHPQSWAGRKMRVVSVPLAMIVGHRGITHSLLAVAAALVILALMGTGWMAAPVVVGYLSHLLADGLTPSGVPLLWPSRRRFTLNLCRTGSVVEIGLVALIALAGGWAAGIDLTHLPRPKL
jgi:inner membrane protein